MRQGQEVAVVTGGARGIGLATVRRLAEDGFHVHALDLLRGPLEAAMVGLRDQGLDVSWTALDVTDEAAVVAAFDTLPRIDAIVAVAPGFTDTGMIRELSPERMAENAAREPRGHAADPSEIAHVISFLVSPKTQFITGQTIFVDGGKSLGGLSGPV